MRHGHPVTSLAEALYSALLKDLPEIEYQWQPPGKRDAKPEVRKRRPEEHEVEVTMFYQTWGSTALGFGGIGGAAMTSAPTIIIACGRDAAVYFGGRLAYIVPITQALMDDVKNGNVEDVRGSYKYRQHET